MKSSGPHPGPRYVALVRVLRATEGLWEASRVFFDRWELSPSQFNLLILLYERSAGCTQIELSRELIMHRSNVTGLVDRLEARGWVKRQDVHSDRRAYHIVLTPAGHRETHQLRLALHHQLAGLGWRVIPGCANFLLACLPVDGPGAQQVVEQCQAHGLFLRNAANMGPRLGHRSIRIAVKDRESNARMLSILREVLAGAPVASGLSLEPVA